VATLGGIKLKNLLISGSSGLVGRSLIPLLRSEFRVYEINRENLNVKYLRSLSQEFGERYNFLHLAWPVSNPDYQNSKENTEFLSRSKELMRFLIDDHNCDLIFGIGTILEHGDLETIYDDSPVNPLSLYAQTKCELSEFLRVSAAEKSKWLRIGYQVSAFDPPTKLVPTLLTNATDTNPLSRINKELDLIHRQDVATAILHCVRDSVSIRGFSSLITTGRSVSLFEFANEFLKHKISMPHDIDYIQRTHPMNLSALGWRPKYVEVKDLAKMIKLEAHSCVSP
jgi:dTDP-4-dehydrorhamnose reductase